MRGFWADEKADRAGWSRSGYKYLFFKAVEKKLLKSADKIITLTDHSRELLVKEHQISQKDITTIRTCADESVFKKIKNDKDETIRFGYLGTLDTAYNFQIVLNFFNLFSQKHSNAALEIYSSTSKSKIMNIAKEIGFNDPERLSIKFIRDKKELVSQINNFSACIFYLNENFSVKASMPTKIGEVLMCGVPIICNRFNNDIEHLINQNCGIITNFTKGDLEKIFNFVNPGNNKEKLNSKCIEIAKKEFSLKSGLKLYTSIYEELSK
jgi:glycosyltransferase involved in cell wall biosynthesis